MGQILPSFVQHIYAFSATCPFPATTWCQGALALARALHSGHGSVSWVKRWDFDIRNPKQV